MHCMKRNPSPPSAAHQGSIGLDNGLSYTIIVRGRWVEWKKSERVNSYLYIYIYIFFSHWLLIKKNNRPLQVVSLSVVGNYDYGSNLENLNQLTHGRVWETF